MSAKFSCRFPAAYGAILALVLASPSILAQPDSGTSTHVYHHEPWPLAPGQSILTAGVVFALLPEPVIENEVPTPAFQLQYKRGLFAQSSLIATISTNVVTNLAQVGMQWNDTSGSLSYAAGTNAVGFLGWLSSEGMFANNWAFAVGVVPYACVGYRFDDFSISAEIAASWIFDARTHINTLWTPANLSSPLNDLFATFAIEQPFLQDGSVSIGFILTLSRTPYQSWILFNTFDQHLLIPEFFVGFQL
jgi:hypothetical protein